MSLSGKKEYLRTLYGPLLQARQERTDEEGHALFRAKNAPETPHSHHSTPSGRGASQAWETLSNSVGAWGILPNVHSLNVFPFTDSYEIVVRCGRRFLWKSGGVLPSGHDFTDGHFVSIGGILWFRSSFQFSNSKNASFSSTHHSKPLLGYQSQRNIESTLTI
jgi:hypothetical protein